MNLVALAESGRLPDWLIRKGIRRHLGLRLRKSAAADPQSRQAMKQSFVDDLRNQPVALCADDANRQHYEVPPEFFQLVLGPHLKYSCCLYQGDQGDQAGLEDAEAAMLRLTCERAELADGLSILELGCGWGSLTLWMAEHYPSSEITAVSNSTGQRRHIEQQCKQRGVENVRVVTSDMQDFSADSTFDRIVSVEMFEHMRNLELLLRRVASWLRPSGKLFVHIFCHKDSPYLFRCEGPNDWMGTNFFTGGMMPSEDLLLHFQHQLSIDQRWCVSGTHYWRTCEDWLARLDAHRDEAVRLLAEQHGTAKAKVFVQRWRMFFMACAELFRFKGGNEWYVAHYRFEHHGHSDDDIDARSQEHAAPQPLDQSATGQRPVTKLGS